MITRIAGKSLVSKALGSTRTTSARFGSFPVRQCHRKIEDRPKWNRQGCPNEIPTVDKNYATKVLDYWKPLAKWRVGDNSVSSSWQFHGLIALAAGIPVLYFFWRDRSEEKLTYQPDPKANKRPFSPRPELATMRNVKHDVAGCPNADVVEGAGETPACATPKRPCLPKIPKPCSNVIEGEVDTPCEVVTNSKKAGEGVPEDVQVASAPGL